MGKEEKEKKAQVPALRKQAMTLWGQYYSDAVLELVKQEGIPVAGITFLHGNPFINQTGLSSKLQDRVNEKEGLKYSIETKQLVAPANPTYNTLFKTEAKLEIFDSALFKELVIAISNSNPTIEMIRELKEACTERYTATGSGTAFDIDIAHSIKGDYEKLRNAISNNDQETIDLLSQRTDYSVVEMTTETRATNRAIRKAVGTGFTSVMEMPGYKSKDILEQTEQYDYSKVREYLADPRLTPKRIESLKGGITDGKHPDKLIEWVKSYLKGEGCMGLEPAGRLKEPFRGCLGLEKKMEEEMKKPEDVKTPESEAKEPESKSEPEPEIEAPAVQKKELEKLLLNPIFTKIETEEFKTKTSEEGITFIIADMQKKIKRREELTKYLQKFGKNLLKVFPARALQYLTEENIDAQHKAIGIIENHLDNEGHFKDVEHFDSIFIRELGLMEE